MRKIEKKKPEDNFKKTGLIEESDRKEEGKKNKTSRKTKGIPQNTDFRIVC